jgi:hypothetical protein
MWDKLLANQTDLIQVMHEAGIQASLPLHWIKIGNPDLDSDKVVFLLFSDRQKTPCLVIKAARLPHNREKLQIEFEIQEFLWNAPLKFPIVARPIRMVNTSPLPYTMESWIPGYSMPRLMYMRRHITGREGREDIQKIFERILFPFQSVTRKNIPHCLLRSAFESVFTNLKDCDNELRIPDDALQNLRGIISQDNCAALPYTGEHGDFWSGNIVIDQDQYRVLDWETYQPESLPLYDMLFFLATYAMNFPWSAKKNLPKSEAFLMGFLQEPWFIQAVQEQIQIFNQHYQQKPGKAMLYFALFLIRMVTQKQCDKTRDIENYRVWQTTTQNFFNQYNQFSRVYAGI